LFLGFCYIVLMKIIEMIYSYTITVPENGLVIFKVKTIYT